MMEGIDEIQRKYVLSQSDKEKRKIVNINIQY